MGDSLDVYEECVDAAVSNILELLSAIYTDLSVDDEREAPWYDFGDEPTTRLESINGLVAFVTDCMRITQRTIAVDHEVFPYTCASVRAMTFALTLKP